MANFTTFAFSAVFAGLLLIQLGAHAMSFPRISRAIDDDVGKTKNCFNSAPCGWSIYVPFTRKVVDYMENTCKCPDNYECKLVDDDLSVSAYVHRCRPKSSNQDENLQNVNS